LSTYYSFILYFDENWAYSRDIYWINRVDKLPPGYSLGLRGGECDHHELLAKITHQTYSAEFNSDTAASVCGASTAPERHNL
jgi:hypothetical protein